MEKVTLESLSLKMNVQAVDPELKQWANASVIDLNEEKMEVKLHWASYSKYFDCWVDSSNVRHPVECRPLLSRKSIDKKDFPTRGQPNKLQGGDVVYDKIRKLEFTVLVNDPYKCEVISECGVSIMYENLKEIKTRNDMQNNVPKKSKKNCNKKEDKEKEPAKSMDVISHLDEDACENAPTFPPTVDTGMAELVDKCLEADGEKLPLLNFSDLSDAMDPTDPKTSIASNVSSNENINGDYVSGETGYLLQQPSLQFEHEALVLLIDEVKSLRSEMAEIKQFQALIFERIDKLENHSASIEGLITRKRKIYDSNSFNSTFNTAVEPGCENANIGQKSAGHDCNSECAPGPSSYLDEVNENCSGEIKSFINLELNKNKETPKTVPTSFNECNNADNKNQEKKHGSKEKCQKFIKKELSRVYTEKELAENRFKASKRKHLNKELNYGMLSPGRMQNILVAARRKHKQGFEELGHSVSEVVNSKCRKMTQKHSKESAKQN